MTRVNLVPVEELMDQHLMAEYREAPMVPSALRRSLRTRKIEDILKGIPKEFTLNKGHVSFFYDKLQYLQERFADIKCELRMRGFKLDETRQLGVHDIPSVFFQDYVPTDKALITIRQRIAEKIAMKPDWYRKTLSESIS